MSSSTISSPSHRATLRVLTPFFVPLLLAALGPGPHAAAQDLSFDARARVLEHWIDEHVDYHQMPGVVVGLVGPEGLRWSYATGLADLATGRAMTTSTRIRMGSVSKIFTSTAVVALRDQGKLDLDDPVTRHLPWFGLALRDASGQTAAGADGTRYLASELDGSKITVRDLLTHTGGLPREAATPYWTDHVFPSAEQLADIVRGQSALWPPGRQYQYSNLGMGLLGLIVEAASGESFGTALEGLLFDPLGMERSTAAPSEDIVADLATGYMRRHPDGSRDVFDYYDTAALAGAANVVSTLEDMAQFAALHLRSALAARPEALDVGAPETPSPASLRAMQTAQWTRDSLSSARGLGFSVTSRNGERIASHGGWIAGHRTHFIVVPERRVAVVALVNADDISPSFFASQVLEVLGGADSTESNGEAFPTLVDLEGTYSDPWAWYYEVMVLDGELYFYEHSYPPSREALSSLTHLEAVDGGGFVFGSARDPVRFERDDRGAVVRVLRRSDYLFPVGPDGSVPVDLP